MFSLILPLIQESSVTSDEGLSDDDVLKVIELLVEQSIYDAVAAEPHAPGKRDAR